LNPPLSIRAAGVLFSREVPETNGLFEASELGVAGSKIEEIGPVIPEENPNSLEVNSV
jgi:hypothetical protein